MATLTLYRLLQLDPSIVDHYRQAVTLWTEIKQSPHYATSFLLAEALTERQAQFEARCGGRALGREIMATVGLGQFYTEELGFEGSYEEALKVYRAFGLSRCSVEVKLFAEKAARILHLEGVEGIAL